MNQKLSAIIITLNEEKNIGRCLDSLQGVADEIIVVDSGSTDNTEQICLEHGIRFLQHTWEGYSAQKNFANSLANYGYILSIDADEALSPALQASIKSAKVNLKGIYRFNRFTNYCGKWIRHGGWYPDKKVRIFPKEGSRWRGDFVHESLVFDSSMPTTHLAGDLLHYSYYSRPEHVERVKIYASLKAEYLFQKGNRGWWIGGIAGAIAKFISLYILKLGFLDGQAGWQIATISAYGVWYRNKKLRVLRRAKT